MKGEMEGERKEREIERGREHHNKGIGAHITQAVDTPAAHPPLNTCCTSASREHAAKKKSAPLPGPKSK